MFACLRIHATPTLSFATRSPERRQTSLERTSDEKKIRVKTSGTEAKRNGRKHAHINFAHQTCAPCALLPHISVRLMHSHHLSAKSFNDEPYCAWKPFASKPSKLEDQSASGGALARVDMAADDNGQVFLLGFGHHCYLETTMTFFLKFLCQNLI